MEISYFFLCLSCKPILPKRLNMYTAGLGNPITALLIFAQVSLDILKGPHQRPYSSIWT